MVKTQVDATHPILLPQPIKRLPPTVRDVPYCFKFPLCCLGASNSITLPVVSAGEEKYSTNLLWMYKASSGRVVAFKLGAGKQALSGKSQTK